MDPASETVGGSVAAADDDDVVAVDYDGTVMLRWLRSVNGTARRMRSGSQDC